MNDSIKSIQINKFQDKSGLFTSRENVVSEEPLEIQVVSNQNGTVAKSTLAVTMRTPGDDHNLVRGFLFTERLIHRLDDIEKMTYVKDETFKENKNILKVRLGPGVSASSNGLQRHFFTHSSCGVCGKTSIDDLVANIPIPSPLPIGGHLISSDVVKKILNFDPNQQPIFQATGGLHAAGWFSSNGTLVHMCEDIGRHNALDKLIGKALLEGSIPLTNSIIFMSGRASFEVVQKTLVAGAKAIVCLGPASSLAVDLAQKYGILLIGFLKPTRFNVYSGDVV